MSRVGGARPRSGRKRIPPAIEALRNFPNHHAKRPTGLQPPAFEGEIPTRLRASAHAVAYWDRFAPMYQQLGTLTALSAPAFEELCEAWGIMLELDEDIALHGRTQKSKTRGPHARPQVAMRREAFDRWKWLAVEFGVGPASLAKISTPGHAERDPVEAFRTAPRRTAA